METLYAYGLNAEEWHELNCIFKKIPEISKVILYGSRARGDFRENSDIDLSLVGENLTEKNKTPAIRITFAIFYGCTFVLGHKQQRFQRQRRTRR